jgi:hypothetical protein
MTQKTLEGFFKACAEDSVNCTPPRTLARVKDPGTSKAAAYSAMELRLQHNKRVLEALAEWPAGMTSEEAADWTGLEHAQVWRRMSELARAGKITRLAETRKNRSGRSAHVWRMIHAD